MQRLRPQDVDANYQPKDISAGPSYKVQGLTDAQRQKIGDFCVWDSDKNRVANVSRDEVGTQHDDQRGAGRNVSASSWPTVTASR